MTGYRKAAAAAAFLLAAPASAQTMNLSGVDAVSASGRMRVLVSTGETSSVSITGADAALVRAEVEGNTLRINPASRPFLGNEPRLDAVIHIQLRRLGGLRASRGMILQASSARTDALSIESSTGAEIEVSGTCSTLRARAATGGQIDAGRLLCESGRATASMGGEAEVYFSRAVSAAASFGGDVTVRGDPRSREVSRSFGGSVAFN